MARKKKTKRRPEPQPLPPSLAAHPRLVERASEAWGMLARETEPMLPHAAVDWLRQEAECEDVFTVKSALYWVAAEWLEAQRLDRLYGSIIHHRIKAADFDGASEQATNVKHLPEKWLPWYQLAQRVIALCREIDATYGVPRER